VEPPVSGSAAIDLFVRFRALMTTIRERSQRALNASTDANTITFDAFAGAGGWRFRDANTELVPQIVSGLVGSNVLVLALLLLFLTPFVSLLTWLLVVVTQLHAVVSIYVWRVTGIMSSVQIDTVRRRARSTHVFCSPSLTFLRSRL